MPTIHTAKANGVDELDGATDVFQEDDGGDEDQAAGEDEENYECIEELLEKFNGLSEVQKRSAMA